MTATRTTRTTDRTTDKLIAQALEHHRRAEEARERLSRAARDFLNAAADAGRALQALKEREGHGNWMKFCKTSLPGMSHRTITNYMALADPANWARVQRRLEECPALSLREALRLLKDNPGKKPTRAADVLRLLKALSVGLDPRGWLEHSDHFLFRGGKLWTYNDWVRLTAPSPLDPEVQGAVRGRDLLAVMAQFRGDAKAIFTAKGNELSITTRRKGGGVVLEKDISPVLWKEIEKIGEPDEWLPLPADFADAVRTVADCTSDDESLPTLECVHLTPRFLEASDSTRAVRYRIRTGIPRPILTRPDSLRKIVPLGMTEVGLTKIDPTDDDSQPPRGWLHFRNASGLVLSCRYSEEEYPDFGESLAARGPTLTLPPGLQGAAEAARTFARDEYNLPDWVRITLTAEEIMLSAATLVRTHREDDPDELPSGVAPRVSFSQTLAVDSYDGEPLTFFIDPAALADVARRFSECEVSTKALVCRDDRLTFLASLSVAT